MDKSIWNSRQYFNLKNIRFIIVCILFASMFSVSAQSLDQIKIAADAGDPEAQYKLAQRDPNHAEIWYRKAANQGFVPAEGQLGNLLLLHYRMSIGQKSEQHAALGDEALKWITLAANQGDAQGQANLADVLVEGKLAKQDLVEAYKWGELSIHHPGIINIPGITGASARDRATLKMTADQITEAKRLVAEFKPHLPEKSDLPVPGFVKQLKLNGISGGPTKSFAIICNETFEKGEGGTVKIDGKSVSIRCLDITPTTAIVAVEGIENPVTLHME